MIIFELYLSKRCFGANCLSFAQILGGSAAKVVEVALIFGLKRIYDFEGAKPLKTRSAQALLQREDVLSPTQGDTRDLFQ